jgi:hypothetical protein
VYSYSMTTYGRLSHWEALLIPLWFASGVE